MFSFRALCSLLDYGMIEFVDRVGPEITRLRNVQIFPKLEFLNETFSPADIICINEGCGFGLEPIFILFISGWNCSCFVQPGSVLSAKKMGFSCSQRLNVRENGVEGGLSAKK